MGFGKSMVWGEPPNHVHDSYFCSIDVKRMNKKKRKSLNYQSFPSVIQPIAHSDDIPISEFKLPDLSIDEHSEEEPYDHKELTDGDKIDDEDFAYPSMLFNQKNLSDLIRDLSLSKEFSKFQGIFHDYRNLLQHSAKITFCRLWNKESVLFFGDQLNFVFCKDIPGVLMKLGVTECSPADWRLLSIVITFSISLMFISQYWLFILQTLKKNMMQWKVYCSIWNTMTNNGWYVKI